MPSIEDMREGAEFQYVEDGFVLLPDPEPRDVWCPVISVDDHLLESPTTFERVPARHRDLAPKLIDIDGRPAWDVGGSQHYFSGSDGAVGRPISQWGSRRMRYDDFRPGVWDVTERIRDMDLNGIWASLCFPSIIWGFAGTTLARIPDLDAATASVQAYNDWMVEEWCGSSPTRFIPCGLPILGDVDRAAEEIRRNAARGVRAVSFSESPAALGYPSIHTGYWDPFLAACEETGTVVNLHVGSSGNIPRPSPDSPGACMVALFPVNGIEAIVDWIFSRIPLRFPDLKIALSEAGVSWVPMVIERLRRAYRQREVSGDWGESDPDPVEVLHRNFWFTSIEDPSAFRNLDVIGVDRVMLEVDYPHTDSTWPDSQALFKSEMAHLSTEEITKIGYANAAALYDHPTPPAEWISRSTHFQERGSAH